MQIRHGIIMMLALAVLAGPLVGCRSSRKRATQPQVQPGTVARTVPPTVVRQPSTTYVANRPAPPSAPPTNWGSPDGPVASAPTVVMPSAGMPAPGMPAPGMPAPGAFPEVEPAPLMAGGPPADIAGTTSAIVGERESRQQLDQKIVALEESLRETKLMIARGNAPASQPAAPTGPTGGASQAARFAALMKGRSGGEVEQNGNLVILRFSDAFQSGSEKLKRDTKLTSGLLAAANELAKTPGVQIQVVGHSDGQPLNKSKKRWGTNVNLSRERAQTVATELSKHGVPASRIGVDGRGSVEPLVFPERTAKDRAQNRRVEIHVRF